MQEIVKKTLIFVREEKKTNKNAYGIIFLIIFVHQLAEFNLYH